MDHASALRIAFLRQRATAAQQRIDERPAPVARRRMDDHPGRLIHHQQRVVFIDDADRDILAGNDPLFDFRDLDPNNFAHFRPVTGLLAAAVDQNVSVGDQCCRLCP